MKINNEWQVTNNQQEVVSLFEKFIAQLANKLPTKTKPFFMSLIPGALLAIAWRRTVTQWLRAAQINDDYRQAPCFINNTVPHAQHRTQAKRLVKRLRRHGE